MKTPLNGKTLKYHLTYSWWFYALIIIAAIFLVDLLYTVTAYHPPRNKTITFFVYGLTNEEKLSDYMASVNKSEMPDMESMTATMLIADGSYGPMQLTTFLAAGEGDVYLLPREQFLSFATTGGLIPLENNAALMSVFDEKGISLQKGWRKDTESGENHLFGIPQDKLPGLGQYAYAEDGFLCVIATSGNPDNALKFMEIACRDWVNPIELPADEPSADPGPEPVPAG